MVVFVCFNIRFIKRFLSDENIYLYESYDGKSGVEYIAITCFKLKNNVIGIRDRDYCTKESLDKVFNYDFCNMEMMIVSNDDVFQALCSEYYDGESSASRLRFDILNELKYFSIIRKFNEEHLWGVNFRKISINKEFDKDSGKLNYKNIMEKIIDESAEVFTSEVMCMIKNQLEGEWNEYDYYNNTQGHDFFDLFTTICNISKQRGEKLRC